MTDFEEFTQYNDPILPSLGTLLLILLGFFAISIVLAISIHWASENKRHSHSSWKKIYTKIRGGNVSIWGTALGMLTATHKFLSINLGNLFVLPQGLIKNGYALVLLSPFVIAWYIACSILFVILTVPLACFYPFVGLYSIIFELPASVLNKDF